MKTTGRLLLDTNIISDLNDNVPETLEVLASAEEIFTSVIAAGELFYGIENSTRRKENFSFYTDFFQTCAVLDVTLDTASIYGTVKTNLRQKGKPIPENDIWMAAIAIQNELTLLTRDNHFTSVDDLRLKMI